MDKQEIQTDVTVPRVSSSHTALKLLGETAISLVLPKADTSNGVTVQAWLKATHLGRGVKLTSEADFHGDQMIAEGKIYNDLSLFPATRNGIGSVHLPDGWTIVLFDGQDCTGKVRVVSENKKYGAAIGGADATPRSMIVFDPEDFAPKYAVWLDGDKTDAVGHLVMAGRYYVQPQQNLSGLVLPEGLEATVFENRSFSGEATRVTDRQVSFGRQKYRSVVITKPHAQKTARIQARLEEDEARQSDRVLILTDGQDEGITATIGRTSSSRTRSQLTFGGERLREDRWHHLACTFDGTERHDYLDGRPVRTENYDNIPVPAKKGWRFEAMFDSGNGFVCELAAASVHRGVMDRHALSIGRHRLPLQDMPDLIEGWALNGKENDPIVGVVLGAGEELPVDDACWTAASLPRSMLEGPTSHNAVRDARAAASRRAAEREAAATEQLTEAHNHGARAIMEAQYKARAASYLAGVESVTGVLGRRVHQAIGDHGRLSLRSERDRTPANNWEWCGDSDILTYTEDRLERDKFWVALTGTETLGAASRIYRLRYFNARTRQHSELFASPTPLNALICDSSGRDLHPMLYWVEDSGMIRGLGFDGKQAVGEPRDIAMCLARGPGLWATAVDEENKKLIVTNGYEIWRADIGSDDVEGFAEIVVSHGLSPNPIAVAVDQDTGALFWLDGELGYVMGCNVDGENVRKLYDAPRPRPGIALDYCSVTSAGETKVHKRLYWTSEPRTEIAATIVVDPGPFAEIPYDGQSRRLPELIDLQNATMEGYIAPMPEHQAGKGMFKAAWIDADRVQHTFNFRRESTGSPNDIVVFSVINEVTGVETDLPHQMSSDNYNFLGAASPASGQYAVKEDGRIFLLNALALNAAVDESADPIQLVAHDDDEDRTRFINAAKFSPDGAFLLTHVEHDNDILCWDAVSGRILHRISAATQAKISVWEVFAQDGAQYILIIDKSGSVQVTDMATAEVKHAFSIPALPMVMTATVNSDRSEMYLSRWYGAIEAWDVRTGVRQRTFLHKKARFYANLALYKQDTRLLAAYRSGTVIVWDTQTGQALQKHFIDENAWFETITPDESAAIFYMYKRGRFSLALEKHPLPKVLAFDGDEAFGRMRPLMLDCTHGFAVQIHMWPDFPDTKFHQQYRPGPSLFFRLGAPGEGQVELVINQDFTLTLTVTDKLENTYPLSTETPVRMREWATVSVSISALGWGVISVSGAIEKEGRMACPETGLRSLGQIAAQENWRAPQSEAEGHYISDPPNAFKGCINVMRFFNAELTSYEMEKFHGDPSASLPPHIPQRDQSLVPVPAKGCMLMSGMDDGSTAAVPLVPFATDGGLMIRSRTGQAHAKLIGAEHRRIDAHVVAAKRKAVEDAKAAEKLRQAHLQTEAGLKKAADRIARGKAKAAEIVGPAQARLDAALAEKAKKINEAGAEKCADIDKAQRAHDEKIAEGQRQYDARVKPASKRLTEAQDKRDASAFAKDGSTLKDHREP